LGFEREPRNLPTSPPESVDVQSAADNASEALFADRVVNGKDGKTGAAKDDLTS
jgi:hypothetical protein